MASIVNAVKSMAHQLGLRVVAEGIEKDEQLALLRALDCEMGQGYLFSRPIDADAAAALLAAGLPAREPVAGDDCCPRCRRGSCNARPVATGLARGAASATLAVCRGGRRRPGAVRGHTQPAEHAAAARSPRAGPGRRTRAAWP